MAISSPGGGGGASPAQDHPDGVNDAGNITAQRQKNIEPEMQAKPDLKEYADRRKKDGDENTDDVHDDRAFHLRMTCRSTSGGRFGFKRHCDSGRCL